MKVTLPRTERKTNKFLPVLVLAGAGLLLGTTVCHADTGDTIARCAASSSKDLRIACLEDALRELGAEGVVAASVSSSAGEPEIAAPPAVELGQEQVEPRETKTVEDEKAISATVVEFRFVGYRRLLVRLDSGQVWRQIDGDRTSVQRGLRNQQSAFPVELWSASLGGYRMRIIPLNRTIRVERVR